MKVYVVYDEDEESYAFIDEIFLAENDAIDYCIKKVKKSRDWDKTITKEKIESLAARMYKEFEVK